jgi:quercetin dioxygenase-like cupin family protein
MPLLIRKPTIVASVGTKPKTIQEYVGRVNTDTAEVSIARMRSAAGWQEPGQRPAFDEYTLVLEGTLCVEDERGHVHEVRAGEAVIARRGEWVRYSTPGPEGADYVAVCLPAFSPDTVYRDE